MTKILYEGQYVEMDERFSNKDFTHVYSLIDIPDGANVYMSCFSCEQPDTKLFRPNMKNVTFYNCNLDNVHIPQHNHNVIVGGSQRVFLVQNDLNDWELDANSNPIQPTNHQYFTKFNLPMPSPLDIPKDKVVEAIDLVAVAKIKVAPIKEITL